MRLRKAIFSFTVDWEYKYRCSKLWLHCFG